MTTPAPRQRLSLVALIVDDYDRAIEFYVGTLGFDLVADDFQPGGGTDGRDKRWVVVRPPGSPDGTGLVLAEAIGAEQQARIGDQAGGRVFLFLETDDFERDYERYVAAGVSFLRPPTRQPYGIVAVFEDRYGNRWDLIERA